MADDLTNLGSEFMSEFNLTPEVFRPRVVRLYRAAAQEYESGASRMEPRQRVAAFLQAKLNSRRSQAEVDAQPGPIGRNVESALEAAGDLTSGEEILRYGMAVGSRSMRPLTDPSFRLKVDGDQQSDSTMWSGVERAAALAYPDAIEDNRPMSPARSITGFAERVAQAAPMAGQIMAVGGPVGGVMKAGAAKLGLTSLAQGTTRAAMAARVGGGAAQGAGTLTAVGAMNRAGTEQDVLDPGAITQDAVAGAIFGVVGQVADEVGAAVLRNSKKYQEAARKVGPEVAAGMGAKQLEAIKQATAKKALDDLYKQGLAPYLAQRIAMGGPGFVAEFSAGVAVDMAQGLPFDEAVVQGLAFAGADMADALRRSRLQFEAPTMTDSTRADIQARQKQAATDSRARGTARIQERVDAARAEDSATGVAAPSDAPTMNMPTRGVTEGVAASEAEAIPRPEALPNEEGMQEGRQERRREEGVLNPSDSTLIPSVREEVRADEAAPPVDMVRGTQDDTTTIDDRPLAGSGREDARAPEGDRPGEVSPSGERPSAPAVVDAGGAVRADVEADPQRPVDRDTPPPLTVDDIAALKGKALAAALEERGLAKGGNVRQKRGRLERYEEGRVAEPKVSPAADTTPQGGDPATPTVGEEGTPTPAGNNRPASEAEAVGGEPWQMTKEEVMERYAPFVQTGETYRRGVVEEFENMLFHRRNGNAFSEKRASLMMQLKAGEITQESFNRRIQNLRDNDSTADPQAVGGDVPNERLPFTAENLKSAMDLTDEQAEATMAVAEAMGLDPEQITLARGQEPGLHALPQAAWHGTAFDIDKFSTDKIGAGEGAQAFGWGLYFADSDSVAKHYRSAVTFQRGENAWFDRKSRDIDGEAGEWLERFAQSNLPKWLDLYDPQPIEIRDVPMAVRQKLDNQTWYDLENYADSLEWLAGKLGLQAEYESAVREASKVAEEAASAEGDSRLFDEYFTEELGIAFADKALEAGYKVVDWSEYFGPQKDLGKLPAVYKLRDGFDNAHQAPLGIRNDRSFLATMEQLDVPARRRGFHQVMNQFAVKDNGQFGRLNTERLRRNGLRVPDSVVAELDRVIGDGAPGFLYRVDLDVSNETLAQWDNLMAAQPEVVHDAYSVVLSKPANAGGGYTVPRRQAIEVGGGQKVEDMTLGRVHKFLESMTNPKDLSMELARLGVSGIKFMDANSRRSDSPRKDYNYVIFDDSRVRIDEVFYQKNGETRKAAVDFDNEGRAVIYALEKPDASSGIHELAHVARRTLLNRDVPADERVGITDQDIRVAERWAGASKDGKWDTKAEEKFARGFEKYLRDGKAPKGAPAKLVKVFAKFKQWLTDIYSKVKGSPIDIRISKPMREVFDKLVTRDQAMKADSRRKKRLATEARKKAEAAGGEALKPIRYRKEVRDGEVYEVETPTIGKTVKADRPTSEGKTEDYTYELVGIDDVVPSHVWRGDMIEENPGFPQEIQGRGLDAKKAAVNVAEKARNFAPQSLISDGERGELGSPIIGRDDNTLETGRQRWLMLDWVRRNRPEEYARYIDELKSRSDQHGIAPEAIDQMVAEGKAPMLVRRRGFDLPDQQARRQFAQDMDTPRTGERGLADQAQADADLLTDDLLSQLKMRGAKTFETALKKESNKQFVAQFLSKLPVAQRARFTTDDGGLTAEGVARLKRAILAKGLPGKGGRAVLDMESAYGSEGANLFRAIEVAAPSMARLEEAIGRGEVDPSMRLSKTLAEAIPLAMDPDARARVDDDGDLLAEMGMAIPPDVRELAAFMAENRSSPRRIGEVLDAYSGFAATATTRADAMQMARAMVEGEQGKLFSNPKGEGRIEPHKMPEIGERPLASNVEIVKEIRAIASDIPFFNAKPKSGARGEFDARKRTAKIGRKDDVSATVHEVGHSIDDGLKITKDLPKDIDAEVRELARPQLDKEVDEGKRPSPRVQAEAFAEWFRAMLVNPEQAEALYPRAHEVFMERMLATESGRKTLEKLGSVSEKVLDTLAASPRAQLTAQLALNLQSAESDAKAFADRAIENYKLLVNHPGDWKKQYGTGLAALGRKVQHWFMYNLVDDAYKFQRIYDELVQRARLGDGALKPTDDAMLLYRLWKGEGGKIRRQIESGFFNVFRPMVKGEWNKIEGTSVFKDLWKPIIEAAGEGGERLESVVRAFHSIGQAQRLVGLRDKTQLRLDQITMLAQAIIRERKADEARARSEAEAEQERQKIPEQDAFRDVPGSPERAASPTYTTPDLQPPDLIGQSRGDYTAATDAKALGPEPSVVWKTDGKGGYETRADGTRIVDARASLAAIAGHKFFLDAGKKEVAVIERLTSPEATEKQQAKTLNEMRAEREAFLDRLVRVDMGLQGDGEPRGLWRDAEAVIEEERTLLSDSEAEAIDKALETYRKISQVAILDPLLEAGIITQSQYDYYGEHQGFYFGFQRDLDTLEVDDVVMADDWGSDAQGPQRNELAQAGKVIHQLRGSSLSFENQLLSLTVQIERAQRAAHANRVKRATAHLLEYNPDGEVRQFQDDYKPASAVAFVSDEPLVRNGMQPIAFRDNGKQRYLVIGDKDFASVFRDTRGDIAQSIEGNPFFKALAWFARFKRSSITTTPWFVIRQLIRDPLSTSILSRNGTTARQVWGALLKSWTKGLDLTAEMEKFELGGGAAFGYERMGKQGYGELFNKMAAQAYDESGGKFILHHPRIAAKTGWNWWRRHIVEPSEYVSRVVEVENALKNSKADPRREHWSDYDHYLYAVGEGRDIMDFAVAGHHLRNLNRYVPFTTAQMRGLARAAQGAKEDPRGFAERIAKVSILPAIAYTAYLQSLPEDAREEYEQMPARLRDLSFPIYTGWLEDTTGIRWLMIPKPYELGLPGSLVQRMISASMGEDGAFGGFDETLAETMLPFNLSDIVFGGAVPVVEWMTNRSLWNDRPIVPPWDEGKDVRLRDTGSASVLGQMIEAGSFYKLDARKADFLVRESLGGWAQAAMGLSDLLRADRGEWTWGLGLGRFGSATGLVRSTTAGYGRDVVAVYDLATKLDLASAAPVTGLRRQLERFHNAQTPAERRSRAETVRQRAKSVLAWLRKQEGRTDRRAARVKSQQRKETFGE